MINREIMSPDYADQIEAVMATLKQDLPTLFKQDITYDIYTQDIEFIDPVNRFKGKLSYRIIFWTLRFHGRLFFTELYFDLHDVQQTALDIIAPLGQLEEPCVYLGNRSYILRDILPIN